MYACGSMCLISSILRVLQCVVSSVMSIQCVAVCCSEWVLQCAAVCCNVLQRVAVGCSVLQCVE